MCDSSPSPSVHPVSVQSVHLRYGALEVLRGVSLDIHAAEGVVLLGANGSGKSTLMRTLNRLARPQSGDILINGDSVVKARTPALRKIRRHMGYVFQQFNLVSQLSVFQNVLMGKMGAHRFGLLNCIASTASHADREYAMACLERVGMAERAAQRPTELSGGQQQRVAIARMLMQSPSLVIADEPIASLDPRGGREVLDLLWEIVRENNLAMLCTLHQLDLARHYADRIVGIKNGVTVLDATVEKINDADLSHLYDDSTTALTSSDTPTS
ncbi:phosphonate ABC transporter ATP-binding protein [Halomonas sp.]|uniref:phosphonate ABC transporter ATP-binding protein n=1 Tax=Halomonas sp. TaxID=1486246 RepID=UPI00384CDA0F